MDAVQEDEFTMNLVGEPMRLVIADDHPLFRGALRDAVAGHCAHNRDQRDWSGLRLVVPRGNEIRDGGSDSHFGVAATTMRISKPPH
jgi:hypothetical protein